MANDNQTVSETKNSLTDVYDKISDTENELPSKFANELISIFDAHVVEVTGSVLNPGLYPVARNTDAKKLIQLAGGTYKDVDPSSFEITNIGYVTSKKYEVSPGGRIFVPTLNSLKNDIILHGHIKNKRTIGFKKLKLSEILTSDTDFKDDTYMHFATIERRNIENSTNIFLAFSPIEVLNLKTDLEIVKGDKIRIYSQEEIILLIEKFTRNNNISPNMKDREFVNLSNFAGSLGELVKRLIYIVEGSVSKPGKYLLAGKYKINDMIQISGNLTNFADIDNVQIVKPYFSLVSNSVKLEKINLNLKNNVDLETEIVPGTLIRVPKINRIWRLGALKFLEMFFSLESTE